MTGRWLTFPLIPYPLGTRTLVFGTPDTFFITKIEEQIVGAESFYDPEKDHFSVIDQLEQQNSPLTESIIN